MNDQKPELPRADGREFFGDALEVARMLAAQGPRVAAVLRARFLPSNGLRYYAAPGYMDGDTELTKQVALVTPDGRVWIPRDGGYPSSATGDERQEFARELADNGLSAAEAATVSGAARSGRRDGSAVSAQDLVTGKEKLVDPDKER